MSDHLKLQNTKLPEATGTPLHASAGPPRRTPTLPPVGENFRGSADVAAAAEQLKNLHDFHLELMRTLAGVLIGVEEFETKIELAHQLYLHAEIASHLKRRLWELRVKESAVGAVSDHPQRVCRELLHSQCTGELLVGYSVILDKLLHARDAYRQQADPVLDRPSIKLLNRFEPELITARKWLDKACASYAEVEAGSQQFGRHMAHLLEPDFTGPWLQDQHPRFKRTVKCGRDPRFKTFHHSREYLKNDTLDESGSDPYERDRLELIRVQRDELDAIETFANVLFDLEDAPFDTLLSLARFVEDEARHAEAGHIALLELGFDPFSIPCSIIGINVRAPMPPTLAFAQINIFGELNIVSRLRDLSRRAEARGDVRFARMFDFIHADELSHVRHGRKLLKSMAPDGDVDTLQEEARKLACRRLAEEGVVGEDYALSLERKQFFDIMGE